MAPTDDFEILPAVHKPLSSVIPAVKSADGDKQPVIDPSPPKKEMKCEVKEYEARYDLDGKRAVKELVVNLDADLEDDGKFALRFYKYYTREGKTEKVTLEIQSPHIRDALRTVIHRYPDQNFTGNITLTGTVEYAALACLVHYRRELREYGENLEDHTAKRHVFLLVEFVEHEFQRDIRRFEANIRSETPCVEFRDIWMLFKPGECVFGGQNNDQFINEIIKVHFNAGSVGCSPRWVITAKAFVHNGTNFGYTHRQLDIMGFDGFREVPDLAVYPLKFRSDQDVLRTQLIARGKKYCSLAGIQYQAYDGEAVAVDKERTVSLSGRSSNTYPQEMIQLNGRVMLDCKSFIEERTDADIKLHQVKPVEQGHIGEDDYMLSHFVIAGFSLSEKRWCWFFVDSVHDIDFDDGAFDALMLRAKQKRLVRALTFRHTSGDDNFEDMIQGKGKGCIFLLHGEPGIGKTFTAESIADDIKRPLYVMMSGELGSDVTTVDANLRKVLKHVTTWKAVLLIDEADVFLEKRSSHDLARNSLVSIFLRTLEYFSGVLFLTTNRINSFDLAFQSRIHLALKYHPLDAAAREQLWKIFLQRTSDFKAEHWPAEIMRELAAAEVNGRQIKNTVRTAYALARAEDRTFGPEQVRDVLETVGEFQADFNKQTQAYSEIPPGSAHEASLQDLGLAGAAAGALPRV